MAAAAQQPTGGASRGVVLRDFTGGLNNVSDISAIANNELAMVTNLELDASGSLVSRPPVTLFAHTPTLGYAVDATNLATNPRAVNTSGTVTLGDGSTAPRVLGFTNLGPSRAWQSTVRAFSGMFSVAIEWVDGVTYPDIYYPDTVYPA